MKVTSEKSEDKYEAQVSGQTTTSAQCFSSMDRKIQWQLKPFQQRSQMSCENISAPVTSMLSEILLAEAVDHNIYSSSHSLILWKI